MFNWLRLCLDAWTALIKIFADPRSEESRNLIKRTHDDD